MNEKPNSGYFQPFIDNSQNSFNCREFLEDLQRKFLEAIHDESKVGVFEVMGIVGDSLAKIEREEGNRLRKKVEEGVENGKIFDYRE
jgi:hypothetical protein